MISPEPHVLGIIPVLPPRSLRGMHIRREDGERREEGDERVGVGCQSSWRAKGPSIYPRDHASPPVPPACQQHRRIFTPLELLSSVLLYFREKFLSEVFRGWNSTPPCSGRQEPEPGFRAMPRGQRVQQGTEMSWSIPHYGSVCDTCEAKEQLPPLWHIVQGLAVT